MLDPVLRELPIILVWDLNSSSGSERERVEMMPAKQSLGLKAEPDGEITSGFGSIRNTDG
jgi:hypothetical protein